MVLVIYSCVLEVGVTEIRNLLAIFLMTGENLVAVQDEKQSYTSHNNILDI
jgi:hypothetical protein